MGVVLWSPYKRIMYITRHMEPDKTKHIKTLLEKYMRSQCNAEELRQLEQYLQQATDPEVLPDVEEVSDILGHKDKLPAESALRIQKEIMASTPYAAPERPQLKNRPRQFFVRWVAAACLLGIIATSAWWFGTPTGESQPAVVSTPSSIELITHDGEVVDLTSHDALELKDNQGNTLGTITNDLLKHLPQKPSTELKYNNIRIPHGKRFSLELADGSVVHLNANSSLRYPLNFIEGQQRKVYLTGEAYFDVAPDKEHPFVVHTDGLEISVLGTQFNVQSYNSTKEENVVLVEGKVSVGNQQGQHVIMEPNQKLTSQGRHMKLAPVEATALTSWKDGYLTVEGAELDQVIAQLETYYNISIRASDSSEKNTSIGIGKIYLSQQIENVMTTLSLLTKNQYSFTHNARN